MCTGFSWCRKAIQLRTISLRYNFCRFSKGDGLCAFFIVEGYQNLIIIQVNCIDEGIHQCLPLVFQAHVQLAEPQQPKSNEFLRDLGLRQLFFRKGTVSCSCGDKCVYMAADGRSYVFAAIGAGLMSPLRHSALLIVPDQLRR